MNYNQPTTFLRSPRFWVALWQAVFTHYWVSSWASRNRFISEVIGTLYLICIKERHMGNAVTAIWHI